MRTLSTGTTGHIDGCSGVNNENTNFWKGEKNNIRAKYLFEWQEPYYATDVKVITRADELDDYVSEELGYDNEAILEISNLEVNQIWEFQGLVVMCVGYDENVDAYIEEYGNNKLDKIEQIEAEARVGLSNQVWEMLSQGTKDKYNEEYSEYGIFSLIEFLDKMVQDADQVEVVKSVEVEEDRVITRFAFKTVSVEKVWQRDDHGLDPFYDFYIVDSEGKQVWVDNSEFTNQLELEEYFLNKRFEMEVEVKLGEEEIEYFLLGVMDVDFEEDKNLPRGAEL